MAKRKDPERVKRGRRNLRRGTEAEREVRRILLDDGYCVARSTRSQGPYDIIAWNDEHWRLIQIKRQKDAHATGPELRELAAATVPPGRNVKKELWVRVDRGDWAIAEVKQ